MFIEKIIGDIKGLLKPTDLKEAKHSVGIAFRVQEFNTKYLDVVGSPDVQIIGSWSMDGIGKTTIARAIWSMLFGIVKESDDPTLQQPTS